MTVCSLPSRIHVVMLYCIHLLLLCLVHLARGETIITVEPNAATGNQSLEHYLCSFPGQLRSDTVMVLSPGRFNIGSGDTCIVSDITNLTIRGNTSTNTVELYCTNAFFGRMFAFINITNLRFENLVVKGCGAFIPESLADYVNRSNVAEFGKNQRTVFLFAEVTDLYMYKILMTSNYGYGVTAVNPQGDTVLNEVLVIDTDYHQHPLCFGTETDLSCTGSGAFFLYSDPPINSSSPVLSNTTLTVTDCLFDGNSFQVPLEHYLAIYVIARSPFRTEKVTAIGGMGVTVYSGQRSYHLDVQILNTMFSNNRGEASSLVFVPYNNLQETSYFVEDCKFLNNLVNAPGRGGGMVFLIILFVDSFIDFPVYPDGVYTMLAVKSTVFTNNEAYIGGAIYIHMTPQNVSDYRVHFDDVHFIRNVAQIGSALSVNSIPTLFIQRSSEIHLEDVEVMNNTFPVSLATTTSTIDGSAALVFSIINNVTISGREDTHGSLFSFNSPGAVLVSGGKLYLRGHLNFSDNLSFRGGAIALFDYTLLHIYEGSRVKFLRNHALSNGGAIFADSIGTGVLDVCVFQIVGTHRISTAEEVELLDLQLQFTSNRADVAGNSIYASPLYDCAYSPEASIVQNTFDFSEQVIYKAVFEFIDSVQNGNEEISSTPYQLSYCDPTLNYPILSDLSTTITTLPGKRISVQLIPLDRIDTRVQSVMYAELSDGRFSLGPTQSTQTHNGSNCSVVYYNIFGPENAEVKMFLYARLGGRGLTVDITTGECPPGFELVTTDGLQQCTCSIYVMEVLQTTCNISTFTINRPGTSWLGVINSTRSRVMWVVTCPIGYCNPDLEDVDLKNPDEICALGRTGTLCGQCKSGLSIVFGTPICQECSNYWLFTIIIYAIAGLLIVLLLFFLDLTVATGTINGLIFYVNIVSVNGGIIFESMATFVRVFISLLNLELGFPICFFDGMDEAAKIGLQYVFPTYLLTLCLILILLSRWSSRIQKTTSCNSIAVLATLFYLSYGKLLRTVIDCLSFASLSSEEGTRPIWLYDGNLSYFSGIHILLCLVAFLVALGFLIPYTLPLVFIKQVDRHSIRLKPLFDVYAGPYKDKYRYWFGLRLVLLSAVCITYAVAGADFQSLALTIETFFIVSFTVCQAYLKPYKNRLIGKLDLFFLLNFLIMAVWLLHLVEDVTPYDRQKRIWGVRIMVILAFITTLAILVYHILKQLHHGIPAFRNWFDSCWERSQTQGWYQMFKKFKYKMHNKNMEAYNVNATELNQKQSSTSVTRTEVVIENQTASDTLPRKETFSQLREPVLDFSH